MTNERNRIFKEENEKEITIKFNQSEDINIGLMTIIYPNNKVIKGLIDLNDNRKVDIIYSDIPINNSEYDSYQSMFYMLINSDVFNYFHYNIE